MVEFLIVLGVTLLLVALNGMFVAAEFSIIGASRTALAGQALLGDANARAASEIVEEPRRLDQYIATAQIGITFSSLALGMYGEHNLARIIGEVLVGLGLPENGAIIPAHGLATALSLTFVTYLHVVFGEMIPKSLALTHALVSVRVLVRPILLVGLLLRPLVLGLTSLGNALLRLVGVHRARGAAHYFAPDELEALVRESSEGGLIPAEGERIFREIIDFSEITAAEAMVPRVRLDGLPVNADAVTLRERIAARPHTRYPVVGEGLDQILGTVHVKDVMTLVMRGEGMNPAVVREAAYVPETASLEEVLAAMDRTRNQMVIVMDEHGGTAGVVTIEDICAETIGDIEEGVEDIADIVELGPDRWQVQGTVRLDTLGDALGRDLEHEDVMTVSGLVLAVLGRPPRRGDVVTWSGFDFRVVLLHGRGVGLAIVERDEESMIVPNGDDG
ncbi:MAG: hemolysin family protein [Pseudomonadales bacterium]